jgi:DNA-binding response OmpR family regulator
VEPDTLHTRIDPLALVVEPDLSDLRLVLSAFDRLGFDIDVAHTFKEARAVLEQAPPTLLVTALKLQDYNGLHLVLRARATWPRLAALITSHVEDTVLQQEASRLRATFVVLPTTGEELAAAVLRTLYAPTSAPPQPPFERRAAERRNSAAALPPLERRRHDRRRHLTGHVRGTAAES